MTAEGAGRNFQVTLTEQSDTVTVRVIGEIDIVTAPVLQRHLDAAVSSHRPVVVIDLAETTFLDARGVAVLVNARKQLDRIDGRLVVQHARPLVRRVLELSEQAERMIIED